MKAKVLVVDDEESIRYTFESFLADEGYDVTTASNFEEAVGKIFENKFDIIFTDIILGGNSGIDFLQEIKGRNTRCPVVMITGFPNVETATDAVRLGAFDYIYKPVRQETLVNTANIALQHKILQDENDKYRSNLEAIFRSVKDAIITVNMNMEVIEVNESARNICGISPTFIGSKLDKLKLSCNAKCLDAVKRTIQEKKPVELYRTECSNIIRPGQIVTINTNPLINNDGEFYGAVIVLRDETRLNHLEADLRERQKFYRLIGQNAKMQEIYSLIEDLADVPTTVLITGESGTGKELAAEAIHYKGNRSNKPIVKVNCSALSENLLESELFGHVKGAFTGADSEKTGRFQRADGGTILLDEIGDISPKMQLRLLRVIQEREFERVGDSTPIKVDVRVIAATNRDLGARVKQGEFREDLYYRLKVMELALPPLRERKDDIPLLVDFFIQKFNRKFNKTIETVSDNVQEIFMNYSWPGNVRELEHTIEHAFVTTRQNIITLDRLSRDLIDFSETEQTQEESHGASDRDIVLEALTKSGWNKAKAARILGINVRTIYRKIEKYNLEEHES